MRRFILAAALAAASAGFVLPVPTQAASLSANDPKFDSYACRMARAREAKYAKTEGQRWFFWHMVIFGALGSWAPHSVYNPTLQQHKIARDLQRHCVTRRRR